MRKEIHEITETSKLDDGTYRIAIVMGISVGAIFMVAGFILCVLGLTGSIEWILEGGGLKSRLTNGSPGVLFALIGLVVLWRYKPRISQDTKVEQKVDRQFTPTSGYSSSSFTVRSETNRRSEVRGGK